MKHISFSVAFLISSIAYFGEASAQATNPCTPDFGATGGACFTTADELEVKFYRLALCESKPTFSNNGNCIFLLDSSVAITASVRIGLPSNFIPGALSIPEGTYSYAMMLIDNSLGIRAGFDFNSDRLDSLGNTGTSCWTNGNDILASYVGVPLSEFPISCGISADANPRVSTETLFAFFNRDFSPGSGLDVWVNTISGVTPTTSWEATLLNASLFPATIVDPQGFPPQSDAQYIWAVQQFNAPPRITNLTTSIDLGIAMKDEMSIYFNSVTSNNIAPYFFEKVGINGFAFTVEAN